MALDFDVLILIPAVWTSWTVLYCFTGLLRQKTAQKINTIQTINPSRKLEGSRQYCFRPDTVDFYSVLTDSCKSFQRREEITQL